MKQYSLRWARKEVLVLTLNLEGAIPWAVSPQPTPLIAPRQLPKRLLTSFFIGLGYSQDSHLIWALRGCFVLPPCQAPVLGSFSTDLGGSGS